MTLTQSIRLTLLGGLAALAAMPAAADVKAGVDAWSRADYATAVREWQRPAERGDAGAQFNLAQAYKLGRGVPADLAKAEDLFGKASAQGHLQASDNLGLLLFQRGERARAMPYLLAASDRGDPRAQYLVGLAHFNADIVPKDWVRAYALVSLARQAGLAQATPALAEMDRHIPLEQRQQSVALATALSAQAQARRARQMAAADLGTIAPAPVTVTPAKTPPPAPVATPGTSAPRAPIVLPDAAVATAGQTAGGHKANTAGADFARPAAPSTPAKPVAVPNVAKAPAPAAVPTPRPAARNWKVQLGAFGVAGNAEALWNRVKDRPELAGHEKLLVRAGAVTKLQAGGFASEAEARAACSRLASARLACIATRN